ncbi:MAG: hypothetical protein U0234_15290 [Sandaracinus sp.]
MRRVALAGALALAGCTCAGEPPPASSEAPPSTAPTEAPREMLPTAASADLPAATPMPVITVADDHFEVSNRALVATWPPAEREAVGRTRPLGDAEYPVVERRIDDDSSLLLVPELRDALQALTSVDRARASIVHAEGTPTVFAIRAAPDVRLARVLSAVYAAGMVGMREPRLVLASPDGERMLALHTPSAEDEAADPELEAAVAAALAPFRAAGEPPPTEVDAGLPPRALRTHVELDEAGLTIRRGALRYGHACAAPAAEGEEATIPLAELTPSAVRACLDALDAGPTIFRATATTRYAEAVAILEPLAAHGPLTLAAPRL